MEVQDCIPVGCVPPARWPYLGRGGVVPAWRGGVHLPGGCTCLGECICLGVVPAQGGVPVQGGVPAGGVPAQGVPAQGGVPARGCTCQGGVPARGGCTCQVPPPWTEWQTGVKILPQTSFAGGKNVLSSFHDVQEIKTFWIHYFRYKKKYQCKNEHTWNTGGFINGKPFSIEYLVLETFKNIENKLSNIMLILRILFWLDEEQWVMFIYIRFSWYDSCSTHSNTGYHEAIQATQRPGPETRASTQEH